MSKAIGAAWMGAACLYLLLILPLMLRAVYAPMQQWQKIIAIFRLPNGRCRQQEWCMWEGHALNIMTQQRVSAMRSTMHWGFHIAGPIIFVQSAVMLCRQPFQFGAPTHLGPATMFIMVSLFHAMPAKFWGKRTAEVFVVLLLVSRFIEGFREQSLAAWAHYNVTLKFLLGFLVVRAHAAVGLILLGLLMDIVLLCVQSGGPVLQQVLIPLILMNAASAIVLLQFERIDRLRCMNSVMKENAIQRESRVESMLSQLCKAVAILDQDLRLAVPSPKLAELLLQPAAENAFDGKIFTNLLVDEDRVMFKEFMSSTGELMGSSRIVVRLKTRTEESVKCEVHHVRFTHRDDVGQEQVRHLLGVCDLRDHTLIHRESANLDDHAPSPEAHCSVSEFAPQTIGAATSKCIAKDSEQTTGTEWCAADSGQACAAYDLEAPPDFSSSGNRSPVCPTGVIQPKIADDSGHSSSGHPFMTVGWNKCEINLFDVQKTRVLQLDIAAFDVCTSQITDWSGTYDFLQDFMNNTVTLLRELYRRQELHRARLGYTVKCNLSLSTNLHVTDEMLTCKAPQVTRTGKNTDPQDHRCFQQLICKKSKGGTIVDYQARQQLRPACSDVDGIIQRSSKRASPSRRGRSRSRARHNNSTENIGLSL